jgi:hypothetical protein
MESATTAARASLLERLARCGLYRFVVVTDTVISPADFERLCVLICPASHIQLGRLDHRSRREALTAASELHGLQWTRENAEHLALSTHGHPLTMFDAVRRAVRRRDAMSAATG